MNKIVRKEQFSEKVFLFEIEAPLIAKSRKAGNFVIVRVDSKGERMPLTIAGADTDKGTITSVVQQVGLSSKKLCMLGEGDYVADVVGPLGNPTHGLCWRRTWRGSDAAYHSGAQGSRQQSAVGDGWPFERPHHT